jgi:hypothetical protein
LAALEKPEALALGPRLALVHALAGEPRPLALRWVHLPGAPALGISAGGFDAAVVLTGSLGAGSRALRVVGRLRAGLADPTILKEAHRARRREELVRALDIIDHDAGESPLTGEEVLAVLRCGPQGLGEDAAAERLAAMDPTCSNACAAGPSRSDWASSSSACSPRCSGWAAPWRSWSVFRSWAGRSSP